MPLTRPIIRLVNRGTASQNTLELFNNIRFKNRIGLGPGVDKDAQLYNILYDYGFSFINLGPVNSTNVKTVISRLQSKPADPVISICIDHDHARTFSMAYDFADMFSLEIPDDDIIETLNTILDTRLTYDQYKPVLLRISHKLPQSELDRIINYCLMNGVDGIVASQIETVKYVQDLVGDRIPIIGYGGIRTPEKAREFFNAGADLLEITNGLMTDGPSIIGKIQKHLDNA